MLSEENFNKIMLEAAKYIQNGHKIIYFSHESPFQSPSVDQIEQFLQWGIENKGKTFQISHELDVAAATKTFSMLENYSLQNDEICKLDLRLDNLDDIEAQSQALTHFFQNCTGQWNLDFNNCYLDSISPELLSAMIANENVKQITLWRSHHGGQGDAIAALLRDNASLQSLELSHSSPLNSNEIAAIADALKTNHTLKKLKAPLRDASDQDFSLVVDGILNSPSLESIELTSYGQHEVTFPYNTKQNLQIRCLKLHGLQIDADTLENLLMHSIPQVSELSLSKCSLSKESLQRLINIIPSLQLKSLSLYDCNLEGAYEEQAALLKALSACQTLEELWLSPKLDLHNHNGEFDRRSDHPRKSSQPHVAEAFDQMLKNNPNLRKVDVPILNEFSPEDHDKLTQTINAHPSLERVGCGIRVVKPAHIACPHQDLAEATDDHREWNGVHNHNEYLRMPLLSYLSQRNRPRFEYNLLHNIFSSANLTIDPSLLDIRVKAKDYIAQNDNQNSVELECAKLMNDLINEKRYAEAADLAKQYSDSTDIMLKDICRTVLRWSEKIDLTVDRRETADTESKNEVPTVNPPTSGANICRKIGLFAVPILVAATALATAYICQKDGPSM